MPSITDVVEIAKALEERPVLVIKERCAGVRNRNSTCTRCMDACPTEAIKVKWNQCVINFEKCVGCQACCTVCPTGALMPLDPMDADLAAMAARSVETIRERASRPAPEQASGAEETRAGRFHLPFGRGRAAEANATAQPEAASGAEQPDDAQPVPELTDPDTSTAVIACARIASKHIADPRAFAEVPCVCRVDEGFILQLASHGVQDIVLVDGDCATCKYRATQATTDATVAEANRLLEAWNAEPRVRRASAFPAACLLDPAELRGLRAEERRGFFNQTQQTARKTASVTIERTLHLEDPKKNPSLREMLKVTSDTGTLPLFEPVRQTNILSALEELGQPAEQEVPTRIWGNVAIDEEGCNACGMCVMFCPTGAMSKASDEEAKEFDCDALHIYSQADCTQCRLCYDSCFKKVITLEPVVDPHELASLEPRVFFLHKPAKGKPFGAGRK